jgi:hypothetical protein
MTRLAATSETEWCGADEYYDVYSSTKGETILDVVYIFGRKSDF